MSAGEKARTDRRCGKRVRRTLKRSNPLQNLGQRRKPASSQQLTRKSKGWQWRCMELLQRGSSSLPTSDLRYGYIIASLGCPVQDPWINIESGFQFSIKKKKTLPYPSQSHPSPAPQRKPLFKKYFKRKEGSSGQFTISSQDRKVLTTQPRVWWGTLAGICLVVCVCV